MTETLLQKTTRTLRDEGWRSFFKKAADYLDHKAEPAKRLFAPSARRAIMRLDPQQNDPTFLLNFMFKKFAGLIRPAQVRWEIENLAAIIKELKPKTVLEIGTAKGGTLFLACRLADPQALVISIDLPGGDFGGGYPEWKVPLYRTFSLPQQTLHLLREDSHAPATLEKIKTILGNRQVDYLFIDGDHTYEGVKQDFQMFSPLVRPGGVIAFHDIAIHPKEGGTEVDRLWNEVKTETSQEFIENRNQKWAGIGVYYVPVAR